MATTAASIEEVISIMDDIVHDCLVKNSRMGYFASLYRATTIIVKEHCDRGDFFEDNDRMRALDAVFANRYFDAYFAYQKQEHPTESWRISFDRTKQSDLIILQHLLMGMNAHISLDLGISTAQLANGDLNESLKRDFYRLNNLLAGMIDMIQDEIGTVSPLLKYMDWLAWRTDETFVSFSINIARENAIHFADELIALPQEQWPDIIAKRDKSVAAFSNIIGSTKWYMKPAIWFVSLGESKNPRKITEALSNETWQTAVQSRLRYMVQQAIAQGLDLSKRDTQLIKALK